MSLQQVMPPRSISAAASERPVVDEVGVDKAALARPDRLLEPGLERHIVGDAAQQGHGGVRVGVDEPRQQNVGGQRNVLARPRSHARHAPSAPPRRYAPSLTSSEC